MLTSHVKILTALEVWLSWCVVCGRGPSSWIALSLLQSSRMAAHLAFPFTTCIALRRASSPKKAIGPVVYAAQPAKARPAADTPKSPRGAGLKKPVDISPALQQFLGSQQASRADTIKLVWDYIKRHDLQSANDRRLIVCDEKLKDILGKDQVNFLEIAGLLNPHFLKST